MGWDPGWYPPAAVGVADKVGQGVGESERRHRFDERDFVRPQRQRWGRAHRRLLITIGAVLLFALCMMVAFEAGHAYAEGVRTLGGFVDHLGEMREHFLGGGNAEDMNGAGWLWHPAKLLAKAAGWLW